MLKPNPVEELMLFLKPAEGETRLPILKLWDLAQMLEPFASPKTGGFSGLTALRHLLECREAWERACRLEIMRPMSCHHLADAETSGEDLSAEPCPRCGRYFLDEEP